MPPARALAPHTGPARCHRRRLLPCRSSDAPDSPPPASPAPDAAAAALRARMAAAKSYKQQQQELGNSSIVQAAATAQSAESASGMRPEVETDLRLNRARQVEFISVDKSYKPATTSWGVFPRPTDISAAYGGGRNLEPGAPLETAEDAAKRLAKIQAAMKSYRQEAGLDVSPEQLAAAEAALREGSALEARGAMEAAAAAYGRAAAAAPLMSEAGGRARLLLAVAVDTLGRAAEARELYTALQRHPNAETKRTAQRLLWGMTEAATFLKAEAFSFDGDARRAYRPYFESQVDSNVWLGSEDKAETESLNRLSLVAGVALLGLPTGLLLALRTLAESRHAG